MKKCRHLFAAFAAIGIYFAILYKQGVYPFGDNTLLVWDMDYQFSSFYTWFSQVLKGNTSFLFSLEGGLGESMLGLFSYYLSSPLNLLLVFFDVTTMPFAVFLLLTIKVGMSAAFMSVYLNYKNDNFFSVIFSCFYALSSYVLCFQYNMMWMDCYSLLPLIVMGIELLVDKKSIRLYLFSLAICIFSNYYIAFMICIFSVLYYFVYYYTREKSDKNEAIGERLLSHGRFFVISAWAASFSGIILVPSIYILKISSSSRVIGIKDILDFSLLFNPISMLKYVYAGAFDSEQGILGKYPMIYAGAVCVLLGILFFLSQNIANKLKVRYLVLFALVLFGMIFSGPNTVWHGMAKPSGCNERFAFLWIFLAISVAYEALFCLKNMFNIRLFLSIAIEIIILTILSVKNGFRLSYIVNMLLSIAIVIMFIAVGRLKQKVGKYSVYAFAIILCFLELVYNGVKLHQVQFDDLYLSKAEYDFYVEMSTGLTAKFDSSDGDAYRAVSMDSLGKSLNKGFKYSFNSLNMYDSTEDTRTWNVYEVLGLGTINRESTDEYDKYSNRIASDILGVKYAIAPAGGFAGLEVIGTAEGISLYKNSDALSLLFPINDLAFNVMEEENVFKRLNAILNSVGEKSNVEAYSICGTDEGILDAIPDWQKRKPNRVYLLDEGICSDGENTAIENSNIISEKMQQMHGVVKSVNAEKNSIIACVDATSTGYMCASILNDGGWNVYVDGKKIKTGTVFGGLIAFPITAGYHEVKLLFWPRGLLAGTGISVLAVGALFLELIMERKKRNQNA